MSDFDDFDFGDDDDFGGDDLFGSDDPFGDDEFLADDSSGAGFADDDDFGGADFGGGFDDSGFGGDDFGDDAFGDELDAFSDDDFDADLGGDFGGDVPDDFEPVEGTGGSSPGFNRWIAILGGLLGVQVIIIVILAVVGILTGGPDPSFVATEQAILMTNDAVQTELANRQSTGTAMALTDIYSQSVTPTFTPTATNTRPPTLTPAPTLDETSIAATQIIESQTAQALALTSEVQTLTAQPTATLDGPDVEAINATSTALVDFFNGLTATAESANITPTMDIEQGGGPGDATPTRESAAVSGPGVLVSDSPAVAVRAQPSTTADTISLQEPGTGVNVLGLSDDGAFYEVVLPNGTQGFVLTSNVSLTGGGAGQLPDAGLFDDFSAGSGLGMIVLAAFGLLGVIAFSRRVRSKLDEADA